MGSRLTEEQQKARAEVLRLVQAYGPGVDFGGSKANARLRRAANDLADLGHITDPRWAALTPAGRTALGQSEGGAE